MTIRKVVLCVAGAFATGFVVSEFAFVRHAQAQSGFQVYVQSVGDPHQTKVNPQGSKVVGFSCANGTCYVATQ
jgi:hypothetical protein